MAQYNSSFNNQVNTVQPMTGEQTIHVDQIDFDTSCPCQITACDGGTIKVCAPIHFDPAPSFSPCHYGETVKADKFVAKQGGYRFAYQTSTCPSDVAQTTALSYFTDLTVPALPVLSTVLQCAAGAAGGGYITINGTGNQPLVNPDNKGISLHGGSLPNTKDIMITAGGASGGGIDIQAQDDINLTTTGGTMNISNTSATGDINIDGNHDLHLNPDGLFTSRSDQVRLRGSQTYTSSGFEFKGNDTEVIIGNPDGGVDVGTGNFNPTGGKNMYIAPIWFNKGFFGSGLHTGPIGVGMNGTGAFTLNTPSRIDGSVTFQPFAFDRSAYPRSLFFTFNLGLSTNKWSNGYFVNHYVTSQHHEIGIPGDNRIPSSSAGTATTPTEIGRHVFGNDSGTYYNYLCIDTFDASNPTKTCWLRSPAFTTF